MAGHKHAALMLQYAQDAAETGAPWERWQFQDPNGEWRNLPAFCPFYPDLNYRRKPKMMRATCADGTVVEWPEPMREAPELGTTYYVAGNFRLTSQYHVGTWEDDDVDRFRLNSGVVQKTQEAAKMHSKALMALSYGGANWEQES